MSETAAGLQRKIRSAGDLQSVVRTMKALAASNIGQYENAVRALSDYHRAVEMGLSICFRRSASNALMMELGGPTGGVVGAVVFGSDQGLVGRFNDIITDHALNALAGLPGKPQVWAVGERAHARLEDAGLKPVGLFAVPNSIKAITPLVGRILMESEARDSHGAVTELYIFHNRPTSGAGYEPAGERLLPLDENWRRDLAGLAWPTKTCPKSWASAPRPCEGLSANISSFRCSGPAPIPCQRKR